jgi:hypothetical protein
LIALITIPVGGARHIRGWILWAGNGAQRTGISSRAHTRGVVIRAIPRCVVLTAALDVTTRTDETWVADAPTGTVSPVDGRPVNARLIAIQTKVRGVGADSIAVDILRTVRSAVPRWALAQPGGLVAQIRHGDASEARLVRNRHNIADATKETRDVCCGVVNRAHVVTCGAAVAIQARRTVCVWIVEASGAVCTA